MELAQDQQESIKRLVNDVLHHLPKADEIAVETTIGALSDVITFHHTVDNRLPEPLKSQMLILKGYLDNPVTCGVELNQSQECHDFVMSLISAHIQRMLQQQEQLREPQSQSRSQSQQQPSIPAPLPFNNDGFFLKACRYFVDDANVFISKLRKTDRLEATKHRATRRSQRLTVLYGVLAFLLNLAAYTVILTFSLWIGSSILGAAGWTGVVSPSQLGALSTQIFIGYIIQDMIWNIYLWNNPNQRNQFFGLYGYKALFLKNALFLGLPMLIAPLVVGLKTGPEYGFALTSALIGYPLGIAMAFVGFTLVAALLRFTLLPWIRKNETSGQAEPPYNPNDERITRWMINGNMVAELTPEQYANNNASLRTILISDNYIPQPTYASMPPQNSASSYSYPYHNPVITPADPSVQVQQQQVQQAQNIAVVETTQPLTREQRLERLQSSPCYGNKASVVKQ